MKWNTAKISDICTIQTGKRDVNEGNENGKYPFFTCAQKIYNIDSFEFDDKAVLIAGNGDFNVKYFEGKFNAYQRTYVLNSIKTHPKYLYYYAKHKLPEITKNNRGSAVRYIRLGDITNFGIKFPDKEEQVAITEKLDEMFSIITNVTSDISKYNDSINRLRISFWNSIFSEYKDNKLVKLGDCLESVRYGTSKKCHKKREGIPVLRIPNVKEGFIDIEELKFASFTSDEIINLSLKTGDVLIIRSNGSISLVGKTALIKEVDTQFLYAGYLVRLRPLQDKLLGSYLSTVLSSPQLRAQIEKKAKSTSGVNNINSKEIGDLKIPLPTIEIQEEITSKYFELNSKLNYVQKSLQDIENKLGLFSKSLLQSAFSGKLVKGELL